MPSNVVLHKVGARIWIARIMITWGVVASATAFVTNDVGFYVVRFLLGVAEAGFFPGIILYLTYWFPRAQRAKVVALFFLAVPLSTVFGAPISTLLIQNGDGVLGFAQGWRFMFFVEGLPVVLVGILVLFVLPDRPTKARWLTPSAAAALEQRIAEEDSAQVTTEPSLRATLTHPRVIGLSVVYFGLITAAPYVVASIAMVLNARHSDRTGERRWHVAIPAFVGAVGVAVALFLNSPFMIMAAMAVCASGVFAAIPVIWQLPSRFLTGVAAAGGIAMINSFGNLSGFAGPYITGWLSDLTGNNRAGMFVVAGFMILSGVVVLLLGREARAAE